MDKELVRHFVQECIQEKEWKERVRANYIPLDAYFKYSGQIEQTRQIYMNTNTWNYEDRTERQATKVSRELVGQE